MIEKWCFPLIQELLSPVKYGLSRYLYGEASGLDRHIADENDRNSSAVFAVIRVVLLKEICSVQAAYGHKTS